MVPRGCTCEIQRQTRQMLAGKSRRLLVSQPLRERFANAEQGPFHPSVLSFVLKSSFQKYFIISSWVPSYHILVSYTVFQLNL